MDITVTFRHTEPVESLKDYAAEKLSKLRKYMDAPLEAHVVLSVEKFRHQADVSVKVNGTLIKGVEETGDMYSALDQVMDKIETQLKRHLAKIRQHRPERAGAPAAEGEEGPLPAVSEPVIEVERLVAKPLDVDQAAEELNSTAQEFLVFRNAKSMEINVIYKRGNGNLVLIEPAS